MTSGVARYYSIAFSTSCDTSHFDNCYLGKFSFTKYDIGLWFIVLSFDLGFMRGDIKFDQPRSPVEWTKICNRSEN